MHFIWSSEKARQIMMKYTLLCKSKMGICHYSKHTASDLMKNSKGRHNKINLHNLSHGAIVISKSRDIYENLAFEDWMFSNLDFSSRNLFLLLMWYNSPSVVIGRHQNPWTECSLDFCLANGVSIARRNSGGGTVYHDNGNLNCSFMTPERKYNRKSNLQIICDAIQRNWAINLTITDRYDILLNGKYKISGTASRLRQKTNAYHHCTVLVSVDEIKLKQALHRELFGIDSQASASVPSAVKNLKAVCPDINVPCVIEAMKEQYKLIYNVPEENILRIFPNEDICPGISATIEHLKSWNWCFGRTPRFTVTRNFPLCPSFSKWKDKNLPSAIEIKLVSSKGIIESISFNPQILRVSDIYSLNKYIIGVQFSPKIDIHLEKWIKFCSEEVLCKFVKACVLQIILDVYR